MILTQGGLANEQYLDYISILRTNQTDVFKELGQICHFFCAKTSIVLAINLDVQVKQKLDFSYFQLNTPMKNPGVLEFV